VGGPHNCPAIDLLKEIDVIKPFLAVLVIIIGIYLRRSIFNLYGQHSFDPVNK
jgi:hypothetical protein